MTDESARIAEQAARVFRAMLIVRIFFEMLEEHRAELVRALDDGNELEAWRFMAQTLVEAEDSARDFGSEAGSEPT
jgi:hypothetical protein